MSNEREEKEKSEESGSKKKRGSPKNIILLVVLIMVGLIYIEFKKENSMGVPSAEELNSIEIIDVAEEVGVSRTLIKDGDIEEFLDLLKTAQIVSSKQSLSELPEKENFMLIICSFKEGGRSWRSVYAEDGENFIDLPYAGIYKIEAESLAELNTIIKNGAGEETSIELEDLLD